MLTGRDVFKARNAPSVASRFRAGSKLPSSCGFDLGSKVWACLRARHACRWLAPSAARDVRPCAEPSRRGFSSPFPLLGLKATVLQFHVCMPFARFAAIFKASHSVCVFSPPGQLATPILRYPPPRILESWGLTARSGLAALHGNPSVALAPSIREVWLFFGLSCVPQRMTPLARPRPSTWRHCQFLTGCLARTF